MLTPSTLSVEDDSMRQVCYFSEKTGFDISFESTRVILNLVLFSPQNKEVFQNVVCSYLNLTL